MSIYKYTLPNEKRENVLNYCNRKSLILDLLQLLLRDWDREKVKKRKSMSYLIGELINYTH